MVHCLVDRLVDHLASDICDMRRQSGVFLMWSLLGGGQRFVGMCSLFFILFFSFYRYLAFHLSNG
jgi:hypothetical protein